MALTQGNMVLANGDALTLLELYVYNGSANSNALVLSVLSSGLFGVASVLVLISVYVLHGRGIQFRSIQILLFATAVLYASTCVFFGNVIASVSKNDDMILSTLTSLYSPTFTADFSSVGRSQVQLSLTTSVTLVINMFVGDSIVWWRAWAVWPENLFVRAASVLLLTATLAVGIVVVVHSSPQYGSSTLMNIPGLACAVLSLTTNLVATSLIAYKTWEFGLFMYKNRGGKVRGSRALDALLLLVESGALYSSLWIILLAYEIIKEVPGKHKRSSAESLFLIFAGDFLDAALVPLIAIYPMLIIVLVAMDRSPLRRANESLTIDIGGTGGGAPATVGFSRSPSGAPSPDASRSCFSGVSSTTEGGEIQIQLKKSEPTADMV